MSSGGDSDTRVYELFNEEYFHQHDHCAERPITGLGSGDSMLFLDVLPPDLSEEAFDTMNTEIDWNIMNHKGSQVPRLISIQGQARHSDGAHPLYRHPADQQPELVPFSPLADRAREFTEQLVGQPFNHTLIQKYRNGRDNIGEHADKTLDISKGTAIVNLSLGASRVLILKSKGDYVTRLERDEERSGAEEVETPSKRLYQKITLPHNSVFVLGWQSNRDFLHSIRADKRMPSLKTPAELACGEQRISLTFRTIATFVDAAGNITGQGARRAGSDHSDIVSSAAGSELEEDSTLVATDTFSSGPESQSQALLLAFGEENKSSKFDWEKGYGQGFDIVNFSFVNGGTGCEVA